MEEETLTERDQQKMALLRLRDTHNDVAKAKSKANTWVLPLLIGFGAGCCACFFISLPIAYVMDPKIIEENYTGGSPIPGCIGLFAFLCISVLTTFLLRRRAKGQSNVLVANAEQKLQSVVEEISQQLPLWTKEMGGKAVLLDSRRIEDALAAFGLVQVSNGSATKQVLPESKVVSKPISHDFENVKPKPSNITTKQQPDKRDKEIEQLIEDINDKKKSDATTKKILKMGEPVIDSIILILLKAKGVSAWSDITYKACKAAEALGKIGDLRAVEPLIQILVDDQTHKDVRNQAAVELGNLRDARAVEPLIASFHNGDLSQFIAIALGKIGGDRAVEVLSSAIKNAYWGMRWRAALGLGKSGDSRAVAPLIESLKDPEWNVRREAVLSLGYLGDNRATEPLIAVLANDPEFPVRKAVAEVLGQFKDDRAIPQLILALREPAMAIRSGAAKSLGLIGNPQAVEPLIAALETTFEDNYLDCSQESAAEALGIIRDVRAVQALTNALKHSNHGIQKRAADALAKIRKK